MSAIRPLRRTPVDRAAITLERAFSPAPMFGGARIVSFDIRWYSAAYARSTKALVPYVF